MARGKQWGDTKAQSYGNESWDKKVEFYQFPSGEEQRIRLVGSVYVVARHWPTILTKFIPGQKPKVYPTWCTKFDSVTEDLNPDRVCPLCDDFDMFTEKLAITNVIVRKFQEGRNRRGNPVVPVCWRHSDVDKVFKKAVEKFKADPADPRKGCDFSVEFDPNNKKNRWTIQREDQTPLSEEELQYDLTDFESLIPDYADEEVMAEDARDMKKSIARSGYYVIPLRNGEEGWKSYKPDVNGKPFTTFPDLVAFKEGKASTGSTAHSSDDGMPSARRARQDDEDAPPARARRQDPDAEPAPAPRVKPRASTVVVETPEEEADVEEAPPAPPPRAAKPAAKPVVQAPEEPEEEDAPTPPPAARVKPSSPPPKLVVEEDEQEPQEPEEEDPPPPPPARKPAPKAVVAAVKPEAAPAKASGGAVPTKHEVWTTKFGIIWNNKDGRNVPNCFGEYAGAKKCTSCPESNACIESSDA